MRFPPGGVFTSISAGGGGGIWPKDGFPGEACLKGQAKTKRTKGEYIVGCAARQSMATFPILRATPATLQRPRKRAKQTSLTLFPTAARHGACESPCEASAPPLAPSQRTKPATELVGIARLAASSPCADAKRGTEYFLLPVRSILNHCNSERVPFRLTVNPYRGCEFGCHYCYARYTHEYMELDGNEFESKIYVKQDAGPLAGRDLANEKIWGEHIAIGTATDPYQPAEREYGATRAVLERMAES